MIDQISRAITGAGIPPRNPIEARPTLYRGVQMRSRLEARVAEWMDAGGIVWQYEPRVYKVGAVEYLPDFQVGERTFVEVKPAIEARGTQIALSVRRAAYVLAECVPKALLWAVLSDGSGYLQSPEPVVSGWLGLCYGGHLTVKRAVSDTAVSCVCGYDIDWLVDRLERWQS